MGDRREYTHIMDAIELVHKENKAIMTTIVCAFFTGEDKKKILDLVGKWDKEFDDVRRRGMVE